MMKKTLLHGRHVALKARMADFGGYEMPLWYPTGAKKEHLAVLTGAGLFDTSHMAVIMLSGPSALQLLQKCLTKDLDNCIGKERLPLAPGRAAYGAFLDPYGHVLDDAIANRIDENSFMVVVNAGMGPTLAAHLSQEAGKASLSVEIQDMTDKVGKIDVQGPKSLRILASVLENPDSLFDIMPYFSFKGHFDSSSKGTETVRLINGVPILLSRTGYTGEFGFELYMLSEYLSSTWEMLEKAGQDHNCVPCGLASRDSLRAGALLPLSHQDIGDWPFINHPWEHALAFDDQKNGFTKKFIGSEALLDSRGKGFFTYPFAGFDLRKVTSGNDTEVVDSGGRTIGIVLTCVTDVAIDLNGTRIISIASPDKPEGFRPKGLCCGFVRTTSPLKTGAIVDIKDRRRSLPAMIMSDLRPDRTARTSIGTMMTK
ncbi:MAG: aminomethyltransferase family protein [Syntrophales bacterium]|nr:aminomethyltransferase family protein [Syntrophales bacterium]